MADRIVETAFHTYRLGTPPGTGGAGTVYEAIDESGDTCAVKMLDPGRATKDRRRRFQNEIRFCERTRHPNIVKVVDYGLAQDTRASTPFYVMPRYHGSLRTALKTLGDPATRLRYFNHILSGVEAAHPNAVIHRDIKPENIPLDPDTGSLVVADFGVAHFTDEELYTVVETGKHDRLANFVYAAPEQRARGQKVDARADIWALGILLNELFTGTLAIGNSYRTIGHVCPDFGR